MNILEVDFLFGLGFHLTVSPTTFQTYCSYLQAEMDKWCCIIPTYLIFLNNPLYMIHLNSIYILVLKKMNHHTNITNLLFKLIKLICVIFLLWWRFEGCWIGALLILGFEGLLNWGVAESGFVLSVLLATGIMFVYDLIMCFSIYSWISFRSYVLLYWGCV